MKRTMTRALALALGLLIAAPAVAAAATHGPPGGRSPSMPTMPRNTMPSMPRNTMPSMPVTIERPVAPVRTVTTPGFDLHQDLAPHPVNVQQNPTILRQHIVTAPARDPRTVTPAGYTHVPFTNGTARAYHGRFAGPGLRNGHERPGNWGWNLGQPWRPAPIYWGGGFWGPWALAGLTGAVLYGSLLDAQDRWVVPSYQAESDSPGWHLLADYGLQQTACGPPNLVDIWGPDNSLICALPDDAVAAGDYEVDPATLTLVAAAP